MKKNKKDFNFSESIIVKDCDVGYYYVLYYYETKVSDGFKIKKDAIKFKKYIDSWQKNNSDLYLSNELNELICSLRHLFALTGDIMFKKLIDIIYNIKQKYK